MKFACAVVLALSCSCRVGFDVLPERQKDAATVDAPLDLTRITVTGDGAVTGTGVACTDSCSYDLKTPVSLTATAMQAWVFDHFSEPCGTAPTCLVPPGTQLTATFVKLPITANRVFLTSTIPPWTSGLAALDTECTMRATAAGLSGSFVAFASTSTMDAVSRLAAARGWVLMDGLPFLDQTSDLGLPSLPRTISYDETGASTGAAAASTGSTNTGLRGSHCASWTVTTGSVDTLLTSRASTFATGAGGGACGSPFPVACFEIDRNVAVELHPPPFPVGRYVFVSSAPLALTGVANADAQCQADADAAGLAGTYHALLATTTESAATRVGGLGGIWRRPDGLVVARHGLDQSVLDAAPFLTASGAILNSQAFFGALSPTALATTLSCNDWTSNSGALQTSVALDIEVRMLQRVAASTTCDVAYRVMCAQLPPP